MPGCRQHQWLQTTCGSAMTPSTAPQDGTSLMTGGQSSGGLQALGEHFLSGILGVPPRHALAALGRICHHTP